MKSNLHVEPFTLGPLDNNTYLIIDPQTREAVLVDPPLDCKALLDYVNSQSAQITQIWLTHAHFDHIGGIPEILTGLPIPPDIALHPLDNDLYQMQGGAALFGFDLPKLPLPTLTFVHLQTLSLGTHKFEVRHTPGHTAGHVVFYQEDEKILFSGDLIFYHSVGRTDLPGGSHPTLLHSIKTQVLPLPPETRILSGHGPATTIAEEITVNPFIT